MLQLLGFCLGDSHSLFRGQLEGGVVDIAPAVYEMGSELHCLHQVRSGVHEPPKAAKECRTQHARPSRSSSPSHVPKFCLIWLEAFT